MHRTIVFAGMAALFFAKPCFASGAVIAGGETTGVAVYYNPEHRTGAPGPWQLCGPLPVKVEWPCGTDNGRDAEWTEENHEQCDPPLDHNGHFGAVRIKDTQAIVELFEEGGTIRIPEGVWQIDRTIAVTMSRSIDVTATGAVFLSDGVDGDLFRFSVSRNSPDDLALNWHGGTFDIVGQKNSHVVPYRKQGAPVKNLGTTNTADALSVRGIYVDTNADTSTVKIANVNISGISVVASEEGKNWESAGGDSGVFIQAGAATIRNSYFRGIRDKAIYLSADGLYNGVGGNYTVDNVTIEGSVKGIAVQRGADNVIIRNSNIRDTEIGIVVDGTDDYSDKDALSENIVIENNTIRRAWLAFRLSDVDNISITGNEIRKLVPFRYLPANPPSDLHFKDKTQVSNVTYENNISGKGTKYPSLFIGAAGND